jgi:mannose-6-phosphate isomerase
MIGAAISDDNHAGQKRQRDDVFPNTLSAKCHVCWQDGGVTILLKCLTDSTGLLALAQIAMTQLPPLRFQSILRDYLWGGRRLAELGKNLGDAECIAESWEIVDHGADQSIVVGGPFAGKSLHQLVAEQEAGLLGRHDNRRQFPLLLKFLDCQKTLSVQVHPNDAQGAKLNPPDLGKTEAWVILAANPGSKLYAGLKPGVERKDLEDALANGECDKCLHEFEPRAGDCVLIEAGTVHALGAGLLVAEIQQSSDTTYRLFDWNRVDRDGKPRELHIEQALGVIDFARGPVDPVRPSATSSPNIERLVNCDKFILDRRRVRDAQTISSDDQFHILAVVDGEVELHSSAGAESLRRGDTVLIPASASDIKLVGQREGVVLDMYLP